MSSLPDDRAQGADAPLEILVAAHASGRGKGLGGLPVASGELTKGLASLPGVNVTLLTVGDTEEHGDARILRIPPTDESDRVRLLDVARNGSPADVPGLPSPREWRPDWIVGHSRFSGSAAMFLRERWYGEDTSLAHVVHMPVERYAAVQGWPERGEAYARHEREVMSQAQQVIGVGPLLTGVAQEMAAANPHLPAFHEAIPGNESGTPLAPRLGESFNILFTGRSDAIKGYEHLLETVRELHERGYDVRLRARGAAPGTVAEETRRAAAAVGAAGVVDIRPYTTDTSALDADYRWANLAVMPSLIEGYGLVGTEAAARRLPTQVNAESGVGMFWSDTARVPEEIGRAFVVPDRGLDQSPRDRVAVWARSIAGVIEGYDRAVERAARLGGLLAEYSRRDAAHGVADALTRTASALGGHTVQGPGGLLLGPDGRRLPTLREMEASRSMGPGALAMDYPVGARPAAPRSSAAATGSTGRGPAPNRNSPAQDPKSRPALG